VAIAGVRRQAYSFCYLNSTFRNEAEQEAGMKVLVLIVIWVVVTVIFAPIAGRFCANRGDVDDATEEGRSPNV
jgi:hypothetical protein